MRKALLGIATTTRIPLPDVHAGTVTVGLSQTETALQSPRAWYDIGLERKNGRRITLGAHIADQREAAWLADRMRQRSGVHAE